MDESKTKSSFSSMWEQQKEIIDLLVKKRGYPEYPLDMTQKASQKLVKDFAFEAMGEMFEAIQHLKNSKPHRMKDVPDLERGNFVEEISDSLHYIFEVCIYAGISKEELHNAYMQKGEVVKERILKNE